MTGKLDEYRHEARKLYDRGSYDMAQKLFLPLAESGDAESQYYLGETLLLRVYDYENAIAWWRKAADQGHAGAQSNLGYMLTAGLGVETNHAEAIRLFRLAAQKGNAEAQYNLGAMYDLGMSVRQDREEAAVWFARRPGTGWNRPRRSSAICTPMARASRGTSARPWTSTGKPPRRAK